MEIVPLIACWEELIVYLLAKSWLPEAIQIKPGNPNVNKL